MKNILLLLVSLICVSCSFSKPSELHQVPEYPRCYKYNDDEAFKIVGYSDDTYFYKHSWNKQNRVFSIISISFLSGHEISCGKDGYEFEVLSYRIKAAEEGITYLEELTKSLRKNINR